MTHVLGRITVIANPRAGRGRVRERLPALRTALDAAGLDHDVVETARPGEATDAARRALTDGCRYLVAAGGDGTVHEVVNGMFHAPAADGDRDWAWEPRVPKAILGVAAMGSESDFVRTFGLDRAPDKLVRHLATETILPIDVGVARYRDDDGATTERLFANVADVGYGAEVVRATARYPRWLGRFRYLLGAWVGIARTTRVPAHLELAHAGVDRDLVALVVANCQFFGGGMKVAPRALPDDGRFNVQVFSGGRAQMFLLTQQLYRGEHLPDPHISEYQSATLALAPDQPLRVEADGELLGTTPASFRLLPNALRLKI